MYLKFFQLKTKPFQITADPRFLWMGEKHKEALATLRYGILDNRGFLLLTGEVGTGKTLLINRLVSMLDLDTVVANLPDPDLVSMDFYNLLADGFNMNRTFDSKAAFLIQLREFLHRSYAEHKQVLLIIDESQRLNHRLMEDIRVLSNIELHDRKLINIFFVGQQEFNTLLAAPQNRALAQRITVRYHIAPLSQSEVGQYVQHRLEVAGTTKSIFTGTAIGEIYHFSQGIPRLINIICDHALLTGYARNTKRIDHQIIKECAEELSIPYQAAASVKTPRADTLPDSKSVVHAAAKASGDMKPAASRQEDSGADAAERDPSQTRRRSPFWRLFYAAVVLALVALTAFAITRFTTAVGPRWGAEELTPQKYKSSLEKERALLARRMEEGGGEPTSHEMPEPLERATGASPDAADIRISSAISAAGEDPVTPMTIQSPAAPAPPLLIQGAVKVFFTLNSNEIDEQAYDMLDRIALYLKSDPDQQIEVRGYTDATGSAGYNESVSRFRANAVKSYLVGKGAPAERIQVFAMGSANPLMPNDTPEGRNRNRRVEILLASPRHQ